MSMETLLDLRVRIVRKALVEEWVFVSGDSSDGQNNITDHSDCIPETPRFSKQCDSLPWEATKPQDKVFFLGTN